VYFFGRGQTIENYNPLILLIKTDFIGSQWMRPDSVFPGWGARGREFESRRPDQEIQGLATKWLLTLSSFWTVRGKQWRG
jgi:hypothetical protein